VQPGVTILGGSIEVKGAIQARGTRQKPIAFTHFNNGNTIDFKPFAGIKWIDVVWSNDSSLLLHCTFQQMGSDPLLEIRGSNKIAIKHSTFNGNFIQNALFLYAYKSTVRFNYNHLTHLADEAMVFDGSSSLKGNTIDSCLHNRWAANLIFFGAGQHTFENNRIAHCGDTSHPSKTSAVVLLDQGTTTVVKKNLFKDCSLLALRIEGGAAPQIIENRMVDCHAAVLLSKTHASTPVLFSKNTIANMAEEGVYAGIDVRAQFNDCTFKNCKKGGITIVRDSKVDFVRDSFIHNGGGGLNVGYSTSWVTVDRCYFKNNSANYGGGLYLADRSLSSVKNCTFIGNVATTGGGLAAGAGSTIESCVFYGNEAFGHGGGAFVQGCTFVGNTLTYNKAFSGGGMANQVSSSYTSLIENNYLAHNTADSLGGGALVVADRHIRWRNNHLENNRAGHAGGGLTLYAATKAWVSGLLINNNEAPFGAGINFEDNGNHEITLSNLTVCHNLGTKKFGSVRNASRYALSFVNCVFWGNESSNGPDFYSEWDNLDPGFQYCVVEGGKANFDLNGGNFNGTWNQVAENDPKFYSPGMAGMDTTTQLSYFFPAISNLYNAGRPDTAKLRLSTYDLIGKARIKGGRIDIGAIELLEKPEPLLTGPADPQVCPGASLTLWLSGAGGAQVSWYKNGQLILSQQFSLNMVDFGNQDTGKYWVVARNEAGTTNSDTLHLALAPIPKVALLGQDTQLCVTNDYYLRVRDTFSTYTWSNGNGGSNLHPTTAGPYWVDAADPIHGCVGRSDTVTIDILMPSVVTGFDIIGLDQEIWAFAYIESYDGLDSIQWHNTTTGAKWFSQYPALQIKLPSDAGCYKLTCFLEGCQGITPDTCIKIAFHSIPQRAAPQMRLIQHPGYLLARSDLSYPLALELITLIGTPCAESTFIGQGRISTLGLSATVVLVKITDTHTGQTWFDNVYIH
jgi:hypothetical protein